MERRRGFIFQKNFEMYKNVINLMEKVEERCLENVLKEIYQILELKEESFQKSYQKNENIREMVKDVISKTQYKNTNDIEKIIESFVQRETRESISFIKQRLMSDIENSIFSAFAKIRPRFLNNVEDVSSENTFLTPVGSLKSSSKQINQPVIQKHLEKPLNNKILPKNSSGVSLKEFLKYEKIAKSSFS